jgi:hypothetical protein
MPLRLFRGRVLSGRETDFIDLLRRGVEREAPAPGLLSFMAGYRRVSGSDRFVLASAWDSEDDLRRALGADPIGHPNTLDKMAGVIEAEQIDHYELIRPVPSGLLDAPGAVLRVTRAIVLPGRFDALRTWLARKQREFTTAQMMLGWLVGWREREQRIEIAGVSAWASPMHFEAVADSGDAGRMLFTELDEYLTDFELEIFQAIELRLSPRLALLGGWRLIVARFESPNAAAGAREVLEEHLAPRSGAEVSFAPMASREAHEAQVFVARVMLADHAVTERLIADHGGQIVYEADEVNSGGGGPAGLIS